MIALGDTHVAAAWLDDPKDIPAVQAALAFRFSADEQAQGIRFSAITFEVVAPGDMRLPPGPWPAERCLIGEARVEKVGLPKVVDDPDGPTVDIRTHKGRVSPIRSFFGDLSEKDKHRMMIITQRAYAELNPGKPALSLEQCVAYIETVGPDVWEKHLRMFIDEERVS